MLGWSRAETPPVAPVPRYLEGIRRLTKGDCYIGRNASKEASNGASSRIRTRSTGGSLAFRRFESTLAPDDDLRGKVWVAAWFVIVRQNQSVTLMFLSRSTGVSSRALMTVTFKTFLLPRRQPSISCRGSGKSQTPLVGRPQTREHRQRQPDGEDQEN